MADARLEDRKKELEQEFETLWLEQTRIVDQGKILNKRLSEIRVRQDVLRWSFAENKLQIEMAKEKKKK